MPNQSSIDVTKYAGVILGQEVPNLRDPYTRTVPVPKVSVYTVLNVFPYTVNATATIFLMISTVVNNTVI